MTNINIQTDEKSLGCAEVSRRHQVPMIGNAPNSKVKGYVFIEFPLPWDPNVEETAGFPTEIVPLIKEHGYKSWAMISSEATMTQEQIMNEDTSHHVLIFKRPNGPVKHYKKIELKIPRMVLTKVIKDVLSNSLTRGRKYLIPPSSEPVKDVFICIHGSRDECCGTFGSNLLNGLKAKKMPNVRTWGVSHVGKHIFAPNVIIFPEGQFWGHVTPSLLENILTRTGSILDAIPHYRGTMGFDPPVQVLEIEILKKEGWKWFSYHRQGWLHEEDEEQGRYKVIIDYFDDEMSQLGSYEGIVQLVKSKAVLTSKCSPAIKYKMAKVVNLKHDVIKL